MKMRMFLKNSEPRTEQALGLEQESLAKLPHAPVPVLRGRQRGVIVASYAQINPAPQNISPDTPQRALICPLPMRRH